MVFTQGHGFVVGASFGLRRFSLRCRVLVCRAAGTASLATWFLFGKLFGVAVLVVFGEKRCRKNLPLADPGRMAHDTDNPYDSTCGSPAAHETPLHLSRRLACCAVGWLLGIFLLPILIAVDAFLGNQLPGGLLYVALLGSVVITLVASCLAPLPVPARALAFVAALILVIIVFVALGVFLLSTSGFEGVH